MQRAPFADARVTEGETAGEAPQLRALVTLWLGLAVAAVLPIFIVEYAPLYDYYNWVYQGRIVADLLHAGPDGYVAAHRYYELSRVPTPNIAAPIGIGVLTMVMSSEAAGRVFLAVCVLLFAFGYGYLVRAIQRRPTVMELFGFPWAAGYFYYKGYESYLFSLPVAFIAIARLHRIHARASGPGIIELAALALLGAVLFLCHLAGWLVFVAALVVYAASLARRGERGTAAQVVVTTAPTLAMLAAYAVSRTQDQSVATVYYRHYGFSVDKLVSMMDPFMLFLRADPFDSIAPLFPANVIAIALLAIVVAANVERWRPAAPPAAVTASLLAAGAIVIPFANFSDLNRPDERLVLPALLIALAALPWRAFSARRGGALALVVAGVFAFHLASDTHVSRLTMRIADATSAAVPADATVLTLTVNEGALHGGCGGNAGPSTGPMTLLWLELRRLEHEPLRQVDLLETSFLRARDVDPAQPQLAVLPVWGEYVRSQPELGAQLAAQYRYVAVFGCRGAVDDVTARFAASYERIAGGENYAVLAARR